jgi:hypothetical protein
MRIYKEGIKMGITENNDQQCNQNGGTNETQCKNTKRMMTMVVNEVLGFEHRKQRSDWCEINLR